KLDGVADYQLAAGDASLNFGDPSAVGAATLFMNLDEDADADRIVDAVRESAETALPDSQVSVQQLENGPPAGVFDATIEADSAEDLVTAGEKIVAMLAKRDDIVEARSTAAQEQPQINVTTKPS